MFLRPGNTDETLMPGGMKLRGYVGAGTPCLSHRQDLLEGPGAGQPHGD